MFGKWDAPVINTLQSKATRNIPLLNHLGLLLIAARRGNKHFSKCQKGLLIRFGFILGDLEDILRKGFALGWMLSGSRVSFMSMSINLREGEITKASVKL